MSIEFLERKKQVIEDVMQAYKAFQSAIRELPPEWSKDILEDIAVLSENSKTEIPEEENPSESLSPSKAVISLLSKHPDGLIASEVVQYLVGHIETKSKNEEKLLYSTLAGLKRKQKIIQDSNSRYRLA